MSRPALAIVGVALIYASIGIPVRILTAQFTLLQQLYLWLFASAVLSSLFFRKKVRLDSYRNLSLRDSVIVIYRSLAFYTIGYFLYSIGISNAKYGNVAVIYSLPMFAVLGVLLLKEKLTLNKTIAILAGFVGTLLVGVKEIGNILSFGAGELATIVSVFFFATALVARKWQSTKLNNYEITVLMFWTASIVTLCISLLVGEPLPTRWNALGLSAVLITGFLNTIALFLTNYGYQKLPLIIGGTISYLDTVFGVLISIVLYREIPNLKETIGGVIVVLSAIYTNQIANKKT